MFATVLALEYALSESRRTKFRRTHHRFNCVLSRVFRWLDVARGADGERAETRAVPGAGSRRDGERAAAAAGGRPRSRGADRKCGG